MKDAEIGIGANYIFGLPKDTHEHAKRFAQPNLTSMVNFYCYGYPCPTSQHDKTVDRQVWGTVSIT